MTTNTILVTGGNGFLGQHVVKHLQEKADWVTKIRVLDLQPFKNQLDYSSTKPVESITGSVTDRMAVERATAGVDCVLHLAGKVAVSTFVDANELQKINVEGTLTLLAACMEQNVDKFVYCSTQDVVIGYEDIINGNEDLGKPPKFMFGKYAETKYEAENIVINRNGVLLKNGKEMKTLSIRPLLMYGELDPHFISNVLRTTKKIGGTFVRFTRKAKYNHFAYVGNVAWAFVCAAKSLRDNGSLGGEAFFAGDDTPLINIFDLCKPYLESQGMKVSSFVLPIWLIYFFLAIWTLFVTLLSPVVKLDSHFNYSSIGTINLKLSFQYSKATKMLSYNPLYNAAESQRRSLAYYSRLPLN